MIEKLDELVTWFYDECYTGEVDSNEEIFKIYTNLLKYIHTETDIIIECDSYSFEDIEDPVDSAKIGEEYRCYIQIPVLNDNYIIELSYINIDGKYSADLEYKEGDISAMDDYFNEDESD